MIVIIHTSELTKVEGDCIVPLEVYKKPFEQEYGFPDVFCYTVDASANLWDRYNYIII